MSYLIMIIFGFIGLSIQSLVKINGINDRTPEDVPYDVIFKTYFRKDFPKIGMSILSIILGIAAVDGYLNLRETGQTLDVPGASIGLENKLSYFLNIFMATWGYLSGSVIMSFGSRAERFINTKANADLKEQSK
jgi:hypothetical protein